MIEDDTRLAQMVTEYLGQSGFEVTHAGHGEAGLEQLPLVQPELVILDLMMPGIDGLEVCRRLRGDPATAKFAVFHLKGDQVQAVEAINSPPEFMMGRQLIGSRRPVDKQRLADPSVSMKEVAAA